MKARIYQSSKNAMQSGRGKAGRWVLQLERSEGVAPEPLMGWTSAGDTNAQIALGFDTLEDAKTYAQAQGYAFSVTPAQGRRVKPRNYADNFVYVPPGDGKSA